MPLPTFPRNFLWGTATAAAQIEGAAQLDGKGPSIWDTFSRRPGAVHNGDTPEIACDHYHRFDADFALMRRLGIRHYRLSLSWPRLFPNGRGPANPAGIAFYHRLFASLAKHGITPWVTLFHWDLPQALEDEGGWRNRAVVDAFRTYAETAVREYRGAVKNWITLNEILCFTRLGYGTGQKAPGARESEAIVNQTYHHALLCHGHAVRAVRAWGGARARVGIADNPTIPIPIDRDARTLAAARRAFIADNVRVLEPLFTGRYPRSYLRAAGRDAPLVARGDLPLISQPLDFIGLNIYTGHYVRAGRGGAPERLPFPAHYPTTNCSWQHLVPEALYWGPRLFHEIYGPLPIYITENGAGYDEELAATGEVHDLHRCTYLRLYLRELHTALAEGLPVKGYFLWSLLDNFEWEDGYERRFGIVHNDFKTQRRTPKLSARWYADLIRTRTLL